MLRLVAEALASALTANVPLESMEMLDAAAKLMALLAKARTDKVPALMVVVPV
jgi:hypothetical protein